jgi:hypothetical protein
VTWTATGGTITSNGTYTAGTTWGTYQVKATSTADPTVSGLANVNVGMIGVWRAQATLVTTRGADTTGPITLPGYWELSFVPDGGQVRAELAFPDELPEAVRFFDQLVGPGSGNSFVGQGIAFHNERRAGAPRLDWPASGGTFKATAADVHTASGTWSISVTGTDGKTYSTTYTFDMHR